MPEFDRILSLAVCVFALGSTSLVARAESEDEQSVAVNVEPIAVGSKAFTESVILGEMLRQLAESTQVPADHRAELGGTQILWKALVGGEVDAYVEYTGTIVQEILAGREITSLEEIRDALEEYGVAMTDPLGFNNTYAIGMAEVMADELGIETISDLAKHPELIIGFGEEFMERKDGWPGLRTTYQLPHSNVRGLNHDLAYRGLAGGTLDVIDLYATDAEIRYYGIRTLVDDRNYFPSYHAVVVYRKDLETRAPAAISAFERLSGQFDDATMVRLNALVKLERQREARVAAQFLEEKLGVASTVSKDSRPEFLMRRFRRFLSNTTQHLLLVGVSLSAAVALAIPLGILAARYRVAAGPTLGVVGVLQTIPSLALLVFMIPLLGLGAVPAIVALFLYSLLPIVRNTYTGLTQIPSSLQESALVLGLTSWQRLTLVELPLASPSILAGVKTAAVINIGTATIGALIGAGGYGQPILTGIRLDDLGLILQGAIPAAALALLVQWLFDYSERWLIPKGLRLGSTNTNAT